jgi:hypothetical protein
MVSRKTNETAKEIIERARLTSEKNIENFIKVLKSKKMNSITLENFIADYLHEGRFCVLKTDSHKVVFSNFVENFDAMLGEMLSLLDFMEEKVLKMNVQVNERVSL